MTKQRYPSSYDLRVDFEVNLADYLEDIEKFIDHNRNTLYIEEMMTDLGYLDLKSSDNESKSLLKRIIKAISDIEYSHGSAERAIEEIKNMIKYKEHKYDDCYEGK